MDQCKVCLKEIKYCSCAHHHVPHKKGAIPLEVAPTKAPEADVSGSSGPVANESDVEALSEKPKATKNRKGFGRK
jgi:hypothetical protein